jgi:hypothetical protein
MQAKKIVQEKLGSAIATLSLPFVVLIDLIRKPRTNNNVPVSNESVGSPVDVASLQDAVQQYRTCLVFSSSQRNPEMKKVWVRKKFRRDDKIELEYATYEVFYALLDVALRGKSQAAKTKFDLKHRGILSRVVGDDITKTQTLYEFCFTGNRPVPKEAQQSFVYALAYGIIIGDEDIKMHNLIIKSTGYSENIVYGIDHEFKSGRTGGVFRLRKTLQKCYQDPQAIEQVINDYDIVFYKDLVLGFLTRQMLFDTFSAVAAAIAANDFQACYQVKDKILRKMLDHPEVYSPQEVAGVILPAIDDAILDLKKHVETVQCTIRELQQCDTAKPMLSKLG